MKKNETPENEFPYETFPWKLIFDDQKVSKKCYFATDYDLKKYIERYKLKKYSVSNKDGKTLS